MSNNIASVTASTVRAWSIANGTRSAVTRGRLSDAEIASFNAKHRTKHYTPGNKSERLVPIKVGRKTVKVESATLRQAIGAGARGRLSAGQQAKAVEYVIGAGLV